MLIENVKDYSLMNLYSLLKCRYFNHKKAFVRRHLCQAHATPPARNAALPPAAHLSLQPVIGCELTNDHTNEHINERKKR